MYKCLLSLVFFFISSSVHPQSYLSEKYLKVESAMVGDSVKIYYTNFAKVGFMIQFTSFKTENINAFAARRKSLLAKPSAVKTVLVSLPIIDVHKSSSIKYEYTPEYGFLESGQHAPSRDIVYSLPYAKHETFLVGQGYFGKFTHKNLYALDFDLLEHTPVMAARGGEVIGVISKFSESGLTRDFEEKANEVVILHDDGSYATYSHFQYHGVVVKDGQRVNQGDLLGYSGHTGLASGPHLHFCVYMPTLTGLKTIPTRFYYNSLGTIGFLEEHKPYMAM